MINIIKKTFKWVGIVLAALAALVIIAAGGLYINNRVMSDKEAPLREPLGEIVEVDGHNMSVYIEGSGDETIVFLSGGAMPSPILEYRSLYSLLSNEYKIAVIEKFGYGFSDDIGEVRSLETIVEQNREALRKTGVDAPYILCPHSATGIEAILWAQLYPDEVKAIIGLDMSVPEYYAELDKAFGYLEMYKDSEKAGSGLYQKVWRALGLTRFMPIDDLLDAFKTGTLTEEEKDIYRAMAYKMYMSDTMSVEPFCLPGGVEQINSMPKPDAPMLLFISDGKELMLPDDSMWAEIQKAYIADNERGSYVQLDCGHYMHNIEYELISEKMTEFIEELS